MRGIDIECLKFNEFYFKYKEDTYGLDPPAPNVFDTPNCHKLESFFKRFFKAQDYGYLGDLSEVNFKFSYLSHIGNFRVFMEDTFDNDEFDDEDEKESAIRFQSVFDKFFKKINIDEETEEDTLKAIVDDCKFT